MKDPVKGCDVYKNIGCAHVDGFLCDYPNCSILKDYKMNERIKGLADAAGFMDSWFSESGDDCEQELKKFAELIIAECCIALNPMLRDMISRGQGVDMIVKHFRGE